MRSLRPVGADHDRRGNKFDSAKSARSVSGAVLIEHPSLYALRAGEVAACVRRGAVQIPDTTDLTGRVPTSVELRPSSGSAAVHCLFELIHVRRKAPRAAPLD